MIDAATFSSAYHAFWNSYTPMCEHFVRRLNLEGLNRFAPPLAPSEGSKRRALVAEYGFSLFVASRAFNWMKKKRSEIEEEAWLATKVRLAPYVDRGIDLTNVFTEEERIEVDAISARLSQFFARSKKPVITRPVFAGCGYVDASEADVVSASTIFEVKTVERPFRSSDVRQVIMYAALNFTSRQYQIDKIGLLNPRSGKFCRFDLDFVCAEISGTSAQDLFMTIVEAISSGDISR